MKKFIILILFLSACSWHPRTESYRELYRDCASYPRPMTKMKESDYFLVILVNARHLDYGNNRSLLCTLSKHPADGTKNGDVGHTWIYLEGWKKDKRVCLEGGHSGDVGAVCPRYMEGVMQGVENGEENPVSYLWEAQTDGYFEYGGGGHTPTYAVKIDLTKQQFERILKYVEEYDYSIYQIQQRQCSVFVTTLAAMGGLHLDHHLAFEIQPTVKFKGGQLPLRSSDEYQYVILSTPDELERSLAQAVAEGRAEYALEWYKRHKKHEMKFGEKIKKMMESVILFPERMMRIIFLFFF